MADNRIYLWQNTIQFQKKIYSTRGVKINVDLLWTFIRNKDKNKQNGCREIYDSMLSHAIDAHIFSKAQGTAN